MKNRVYRGRSRKSQLVSDSTDLGDDLERPEVLEAQLVVGPWSQGGLYIRLETQVDELAHLEGSL